MNNKDVCDHHPEQVLVGVCPYCLNQKLLAVAAPRAHGSVQGDGGGRRKAAAGSIVGLPAKVLALGSLHSSLDLRRSRRIRQRSYNGCDGGGSDPNQSDSSSLEDSFISIKFEDNGVALWDNSKVAKASQDQSGKLCAATTATTEASTNIMGLTKEGRCRSSSNKSEVKHAKATRVLLRWRKRIGLLLQRVKWKRSKKGSGGASHVDGVGRVVKGRIKGWIRALTMRRTNKE